MEPWQFEEREAARERRDWRREQEARFEPLVYPALESSGPAGDYRTPGKPTADLTADARGAFEMTGAANEPEPATAKAPGSFLGET